MCLIRAPKQCCVIHERQSSGPSCAGPSCFNLGERSPQVDAGCSIATFGKHLCSAGPTAGCSLFCNSFVRECCQAAPVKPQSWTMHADLLLHERSGGWRRGPGYDTASGRCRCAVTAFLATSRDCSTRAHLQPPGLHSEIFHLISDTSPKMVT